MGVLLWSSQEGTPLKLPHRGFASSLAKIDRMPCSLKPNKGLKTAGSKICCPFPCQTRTGHQKTTHNRPKVQPNLLETRANRVDSAKSGCNSDSTDCSTQTSHLDSFRRHPHHSSLRHAKHHIAGGNLNLNGSTIDLKATITGAHGIFKADTMMMTNISAKTYSPGAGNIWC